MTATDSPLASVTGAAPARPTRSITLRLIAAVLAVELVASAAAILFSLGYERHIHFRAFDIMLRGRADSVLGAVQDAEDPGDNVMLDRPDLHLPPDDLFAVWDQHGRLLGSSPNWQSALPAYDPNAADGYSHLILAGRHYRLLHEHGSRIIDPGDPGGGIMRRVIVVYGAPTGHLWRAIRRAVEFYAAGTLFLLLVTGPLIAWLLHRGLVPLRQLASLASKVDADSWEFHPPASATQTRELAPLTHALENVLARLERAFVQQRTFVSDAAHELKTAVAVAKSSLQLLVLKPRTAVEYQSGVERCLSDVARLEDLVAKMLTLARVESAPAPAAPAQCDLAQVIHQIAAELSSIAELRGVRVNLPATANDPAPVLLSAEDASLLVSNLLLNALQHSPAGSVVDLHLRTLDNSIEFAVEDHGDGIRPEALPHVFDRFYRGDPSRTRATGGAGLGLAICRAVTEKSSGSVHISSQLAAGTTVTIRLPRA